MKIHPWKRNGKKFKNRVLYSFLTQMTDNFNWNMLIQKAFQFVLMCTKLMNVQLIGVHAQFRSFRRFSTRLDGFLLGIQGAPAGFIAQGVQRLEKTSIFSALKKPWICQTNLEKLKFFWIPIKIVNYDGNLLFYIFQ